TICAPLALAELRFLSPLVVLVELHQYVRLVEALLRTLRVARIQEAHDRILLLFFQSSPKLMKGRVLEKVAIAALELIGQITIRHWIVLQRVFFPNSNRGRGRVVSPSEGNSSCVLAADKLSFETKSNVLLSILLLVLI